MKIITSFLIIFILISGVNLFAQSKTELNQVEVKIAGLSCPFCAYGLEKKVKKIDGAQDIKIDVKNGTLTFSLEEGKTVSEQKVKNTVKDAGFTTKEIQFKKVTQQKDKKNKNENDQNRKDKRNRK